MGAAFRIQGLGGTPALSGTIAVEGAKNAVIKSMAASLLFEDTLTISNVPAIEDVARMGELLENLGGEVRASPGIYSITTNAVSKWEIDSAIAGRLRASIVLTGPLLGRFGKVSFPHPGGDVIGPRPINLFLEGFERMGCTIHRDGDHYSVEAKNGKLIGAEIFFMFVSVTATETLMMAATLAQGKTTLKNAAMEPEIVALAGFLNSCGAKIKGAGTPTITIEGAGMLSAEGKTIATIPDRIETGSFLLLGALAAKELTITGCVPEHIEILIALLRESGISIETTDSSITVKKGKQEKFRPLAVRTHEYPGFATDLQPPMAVYLTQVSGKSTIFETIFEGRFNYTKDLVRMGASVTSLHPQLIAIEGPTPLVGKELQSPDIRGGLAYLIAAVIAQGESIIDNIYHIDRGYEKIEDRLRNIGVSIERFEK